MSSETASAVSSMWLTYIIQSTAGYIVLWPLNRFVRDRRLRFCVCGVYLGWMAASWVGLLVFLIVPASASFDNVALLQISDSHWPWTFNLALTLRFVRILSTGCWIYVAIVIPLLMRFSARLWQLRVLLQASQPASRALSSLFESVCSEIQGPRCELRVVRGLCSPAAAGWLHPMILMPDGLASRLEVPQLVGILRHELIHVRRRDYLWDKLATLGCYLVFFHPAAWLLRRHLRWDRELICDEGAVGHLEEVRLEYAGCLMTLASWQRSGDNFAVAIDLLSSPSLLATRVRTLLLPRTEAYSAIQNATLPGLIALSLAFTLGLAPKVTVLTSPSTTPITALTAAARQESQPQLLPTLGKRVLQQRKLSGAKANTSEARLRRPSHALRITRANLEARSSSQVRAQTSQTRRRTPLHFISEAGGWTIRSVKLGFTKIESHLRGR
jgi:beta-lactamase regulating signal transducer with metallopeptidase domain